MLIKITNFCSMGCSHCMEDSTVAGEHMPEDLFIRSLDFIARAEKMAWELGCPKTILLSGGELTEHPNVVRYIEIVVQRGWFPMLITNGMWLADKELREAILRPEWKNMFVQVTNDPRFYPKAPPRVEDPRLCYVDALTQLMPLGRASRREFDQLPKKKAPSSFNVRSLTRSFRSVERALALIRSRAAVGFSGHCSPSISENGDVVAGETRNCFKVGTVDSSLDEITANLISMRCNRCGLVDNLSLEQKRAINETTLYSGGE